MNIFEYAEKYSISLKKARQQVKDGVLRLDETIDPQAVEIQDWLSQGQKLTAAQLCVLIESPGIILDLGRYAPRAEEQIAALGNAKGEAAPKMVAAYITDAAHNDAEAVRVLVDWIKQILPVKPVSHNYIAVRLLLGLAANVRQYDVPRIPRALLNCRKLEEFASWWSVENRKSRSVTIYQRPTKKDLANLDL
jgi:hypothetical protein